MSTVVETTVVATEPVVVDSSEQVVVEKKPRAKPLAAKYMRPSVFAVWVVRECLSQGTLSGDLTSVIDVLKMVESVEEQTEFHKTFDADYKDTVKFVKSMVKDAKKGPTTEPKKKTAKSKKNVETSGSEEPVLSEMIEKSIGEIDTSEVPDIVSRIVASVNETKVKKPRKKAEKKTEEPVVEQAVEPVVEQVAEPVVEKKQRKKAAPSGEKKPRKKADKKAEEPVVEQTEETIEMGAFELNGIQYLVDADNMVFDEDMNLVGKLSEDKTEIVAA